jgi:hypothetical protein
MLHSKLCQQYFCTLHSTKCKTLNLKCREFHLNLTLALIPNQSYARMHRLCIGYAYAYSYYPYPCISIHECLDVHIGTGNSHAGMDEHRLLHDRFMPNMYKDEYLKEPNSRYGYMHIWVLSRFISRIFNISRQHW